jgi:hypothetical protein
MRLGVVGIDQADHLRSQHDTQQNLRQNRGELDIPLEVMLENRDDDFAK